MQYPIDTYKTGFNVRKPVFVVVNVSVPVCFCEIGPFFQEFYLNITTFEFLCFPSSSALIVEYAIALRFFAPVNIISIQLKLFDCGFKLFFNIYLKFLVICSSAIYSFSD